MPYTDADLAEILSRQGYRIAPESPSAKPIPQMAINHPPVAIQAETSHKASQPDTRKLALAMSEDELQTSVIDLAHLYKWKVAHFRSVKVTRKDGSTFWQTPVQADGQGFVDLVLCRAASEGLGRVIFAELKTERGKIEPAQRDWLALLKLTQRVEVFVFRPSDWLNGTVDKVLC